MNVLTAENLYKSYGMKTLFSDISFTITDASKIGVIGINGTGKSTLLKIVAGLDSADAGNISTPSGTRIEYLSQTTEFDKDSTVLKEVFKGDSIEMRVLRDYEDTLEKVNKFPEDSSYQERLIRLTDDMTKYSVWGLESQAKTVLTKLGITEFDKEIRVLSGGEKKRVALASVLLSPCDLLVLDEPTNHMDSDTIDWLENYLKNMQSALLIVTHDRYFLERVVNQIFELDGGHLYTYSGNYSEFLEKKLEREETSSSLAFKKNRLYKRELEWMKKGAKARTTKQKARIQRFEDLRDSRVREDKRDFDISVGASRLGKKIIEIRHVSKSFSDKVVLDDFSYIFLREDRIGVIGKSGIGKSTLLNIIMSNIMPDTGEIEIGPTVKIAYFSQELEEMNLSLRAIEYIKESGEFVTTSDGTKISASQMMEKFLFSPDMQWSIISKLSGGERRRLYLLKILMSSPNVLILDEPTNDLDLDTLKVLEEYLEDFSGPVITVSHDRYFLDVVCNKIFSFEGNGRVIVNNGNYRDFFEKRDKIVEIEKNEKKIETKAEKVVLEKKKQKPKFSYKEKLEYERISKDIDRVEEDIDEVDKLLELHSSDYTKLEELFEKKTQLEDLLLEKLERQEYLINLEKEIREFK